MELKLNIDFDGFEFDPSWTEEELGKQLIDFVAETCTCSVTVEVVENDIYVLDISRKEKTETV